MVRAKFKVQRIEATEGVKDSGEKNAHGQPIYVPCELRTIVLMPVYSTDSAHENKRFWDASPSGEIRLGTVNPSAWKQFVLGGEYYVDFTKVD